jgi:hypothetical protein
MPGAPAAALAWKADDDDLFDEPVAPFSSGPEPPAVDADTVVSFVNPFSGDGAAHLDPKSEPIVSNDLVRSIPDTRPMPQAVLEVIEQPTQFDTSRTDLQDRPLQPAPFAIKVPEAATQRVAVRQEDASKIDPVVSTPNRAARRGARSNARMDLQAEAMPDDIGTERFQEIPIPDRADSNHDPLEEPPISNRGDTSEKARLIEEPQLEGTPSSDRRHPGQNGTGARRGLDESQLGKRLAKRVRTMFRLLDEVDYYQMLSVDPQAPEMVLKRAYFDLSLEFHPDRFFLLRSGDLKEKIYAIYRRITEAYTVLSDERRRRAYEEARLQRHQKRASPELRNERDSKPPAVARANGEESKAPTISVETYNPKAKRFVDLARAAMVDGDLNGARLHLNLALSYEANNDELIKVIGEVVNLARPAH